MTNETNPGAVPALQGDAVIPPVELARQIIAHLDECNRVGKFSSIGEEHIRAICEALIAQSQPAATVQEVGRELRDRISGGEFFVDGDKFDLIFRPGGGNYGGADKVVARMACGDTAYWLPSLIARFLNAALTAEPAAKAGDAVKYPGSPMSDADLTKHYEASKHDVVGLVGSEVRQIIGELRHYRANPPSPQPDMGSGTDDVREQVARIISLAKGQPETGQTSIGAWWWDARHERAKPEHFEGECREEDRKHADLMIPLLRAVLSSPASQSVEKQDDVEAIALAWLDRRVAPEHPNDVPAFGADDMVDAFISGVDYRRSAVTSFANALKRGNFANVSLALNQRMCCNGHMCGCRGATVGEYIYHEMRAALLLPHKEEATPATTTERVRG